MHARSSPLVERSQLHRTAIVDLAFHDAWYGALADALRTYYDFSGFQAALNEMKVVLVRLQLRHRHILNCDRVVGGIGNDSIAMGVIVDCRPKRVNICEDGFADLDGVCFGRKVSNCD